MTPSQVPANFLNLPDIVPDIYRASSSLDAVKKHIETLEKEIESNPSNMNAMLVKNAFEQYHYSVSQLGEEHKKLFIDLHKSTVKNHPTLYIKTIARTKSVIRFYNKCRRKIFEGRPVSEITDIYAGRISIDDNSLTPQELIKLCYTVADEAIIFMIAQGYLPCQSSGVKDVSGAFDAEKFPYVVLPAENYLNPSNANLIKDYIASPKTLTGYQSIHIVFINASGRRVELQIRTALMDHHAENYEIARHDFYEEMQDDELPPLNLDRNKIHMSFYTYLYGNLSDDAGLEKSSPCMQETYYGLRNKS